MLKSESFNNLSKEYDAAVDNKITEWLYSPSILINLPVEKNNAEVSAFYQAITDWVKENHSEYVTSYGNNDYYYGGSAYQNNFDFRVSAWQGQGTYDGMSSDAINIF